MSIEAREPERVSLSVLDMTAAGDPEAARLLEAVTALRTQAWASRGVTFDAAGDALDRKALHVFGHCDRRLVAAARLSLHAPEETLPDGMTAADVPGAVRIGVLTRLAVDPSVRGQGLAARLDAIRIERAIAGGCSHLLMCTSTPSRPAALVALGFEQVRVMRSVVTGLPGVVLARKL